MKEKRLLKVLGEIDEKYVEEAAPAAKKAGGEKSKRVFIPWGVTAACLCLLCVSAIAVSGRFRSEPSPDNGWNDIPGVEQTALPDAGQTVTADSDQMTDGDYAVNRDQVTDSGQAADSNPEAGEQEVFVPVSSLFAEKGDGIQQAMAFIGKASIGKYTGVYEKVQSVESTVLSESRGRNISGTEEWYCISGHTDMQYLIRNDNGEYSLWKFSCFDSGEYPYRDVLELVYGIDSADVISEIRVSPPKMDNTNEGMAIQKKIGTHTITDREQISTIYEVLSSMTCYGSDHWDMIDNGSTDAPADAKLPSHQAVWLGRYLSIVTDYGNEIDGLKYTAVSDMFYEFSGISYNRLTEEQAAKVWEIIGITEDGETKNEEIAIQNSADFPFYATAQELVEAADLIFSGSVESMTCEMLDVRTESGVDSLTGLSEAQGILYTLYEIKVSKVYKGTIEGDTLTIKCPGGEVDGSLHISGDVPGISQGGTYLFLAENYKSTYPSLLNTDQACFDMNELEDANEENNEAVMLSRILELLGQNPIKGN